VVLTGPTDYVSDGKIVVSLKNGHEYLGKITGSGCIVGSSIASYCAAASATALEDGYLSNAEGSLVEGDMLLSAIAGLVFPYIPIRKLILNSWVQRLSFNYCR
jgi:thiamine-phosphate diphosphorylase/hydroxyethylthiazole kinase